MQPLVGPYTWQAMTAEDLRPAFLTLRPLVFGSTMALDPEYALAPENRAAVAALRANMAGIYTLRLGVFFGDSLVAWHFGWQLNAQTYSMTNTGVLPEHRRKGIYAALLMVVLGEVRRAGFQIVTSSHAMTNNAVLIPKLRAGFVIQGFEVNELFGSLVRLVYFFDALPREVFDYRVGWRQPGPAVRALWPEVFDPPRKE